MTPSKHMIDAGLAAIAHRTATDSGRKFFIDKSHVSDIIQAALEAMWRPTDEVKPELREPVLAIWNVEPLFRMGEAWWTGGKWFVWDAVHGAMEIHAPTHWRPRGPLPQEGKSD